MKQSNFLSKRIFLFTLFSLFFLAVTSAAIDTNDVDDVFQIHDVIDYSKPCRNNGSYCSSSAGCNFTVKNAENGIMYDNAVATYNTSNGEANLTIYFNSLGIWTIEGICCDGNDCGSDTFYAEVTGSGFNDTLGFFILMFGISGAVIGLGLWKQDEYITILGTFGLFFMGIYILLNGIAGIRDTTTTWATGIIVLGIAMYISGKAGYELVTD